MLNFELSTFIFQVINFFLLLAVLTWFFYRPVMRVMRARQEDVARRLNEADAKAKAADEERQQLAEALDQARSQAEELVAEARTEAARTREETLTQAHQEAARLREESERRVAEQQREALLTLERRASQTALQISEHLLKEAGGLPFHEALVEKLLREGLALVPEQAEQFRKAVHKVGGVVTLEVPYEPKEGLMEDARTALATALEEADTAISMEVRLDPLLIAGLRFVAGGVALDLSVRGSLAAVELGSGGQDGQ